ncbi:BlaI/MecI/CopY family transcriptional regulator [Neofamilia massiliensis]|uniref:BlaI/MecI/CopY family transcriptional regulator n=1 Tax=Neofamilia massiliensis TaxID=1673724 RepID=UPI0006BB5DC7|nr:BlaI/MecI/CopY family transcriptional regulator [Neofamilia massiliensis]
MKIEKLSQAEENLGRLIWDLEPIKSADLVDICKEKYSWSKSTTYTLLRRIEKKGVFENKNSTVRSKMSFDDYQGKISQDFIEENYAGSLPRFLTAFTRKNKLTDDEIKELEDLIAKHKEE